MLLQGYCKRFLFECENSTDNNSNINGDFCYFIPMWDFLKKIFSERKGNVTVVVLDEQNPDGSGSFKLASKDIVKVTLLVITLSVFVTTILFFATPLGSLYQSQSDEAMRREVLEISERLIMLQDSLNARDQQLRNMKNVLQQVPDTTYDIGSNRLQYEERSPREPYTESPFLNAYDMLSQDEIILSSGSADIPDFPAKRPIEGKKSQGFNPEKGHFGIDIASKSNTNFTAMADGVVIHRGWTINFGHVIYLQHSNGIISVYKHAAKSLKKQGDYVLKGDILGTVADTGVLSSGSHLHIEVWKNGIPQNPEMYIIN